MQMIDTIHLFKDRGTINIEVMALEYLPGRDPALALTLGGVTHPLHNEQ